jgi:hypothetical protein
MQQGTQEFPSKWLNIEIQPVMQVFEYQINQYYSGRRSRLKTVITFGQTITNPINRMITISK